MKNYFEYLGIKIYLADFKPKHWLLHENEFWKDIFGFENLYRISTKGRVLSLDRVVSNPKGPGTRIRKGRYLITTIDNHGYPTVNLYKLKNLGSPQIVNRRSVHYLVATNFIKNPKNRVEVNHKDGKKHNSILRNLEWCTHLENVRHANKNGLINYAKGEKQRSAKLKEYEVIQIRSSFKNKEMTAIELSIEYNVCRSSINAIVSNKIWRHLL